MTESGTSSRPHKSRLSSASIVMAATMLSRVLGFVRQAIINAVFGASGTADVLNAVFNIPNNLRKLLAEGALSSAFIPVLSRAIADSEKRTAGVPRQVVRNLLTFQMLILLPILVGSAVFAGPVVGLFYEFPEIERQVLAADLFRWFIHYTLLISMSAVLMGSLNSSNRFTIPALTPLVFSVSVISSVLLLHRSLGVYSMAVGVLAGGVGQILFQTPQFLKVGFTLAPSFAFRNPEFKRIVRSWLPVLASSSAFVVNQIIAVRFATGLEDGSTSALTNALTFWQLPIGIFGASITTVLFPRMSREAMHENPERLRETMSYGIRALLAFLVPSALLLGALSFESISVVLERGRFTAENTRLAARVLIGYCLGMPSVGLFNFLQRSFYSRGDYRTPAITAFIVLIIDVALSLVLKETALRVVGLAVANSIAFTVGTGILFVVSHRVLRGLNGHAIATTVAKVCAAIAPAAAALLFFRLRYGNLWREIGSGPRLGLLAAVGFGALAVTALMYWLLRVRVVSILLKRRPK